MTNGHWFANRLSRAHRDAAETPVSRNWLDVLSVALGCALVVIATVAAVLSDQQPASAAGVCVTSNLYYDAVAALHTPVSYQGTSSYIVVQDAPLCSNDDGEQHFSATYVMIKNGNGYGWGQVGFVRVRGFPLQWFSQYWKGSGSTFETHYSGYSIDGEIGVRHAFRTFYSATCPGNRPCLASYIDSTQFSLSTFDPFAYWNVTPWVPEYAGEVDKKANDITGTPSAHTSFTGMGVYTPGQNISLPCGYSATEVDETRFGLTQLSCIAMDIWTINPDTGGFN
jgi:hypothetical protein